MEVDKFAQLVADKYEFMRPIVQGWILKIEASKDARSGFDSVAKQCIEFFSGAVGFMWEASYQKKYMGGRMTPRFKITLAKAFELVALFGPVLYWKNPQRVFKPRKTIKYTPEMFGGEQDPRAQQLFQMAMMEQQQRASEESIREQLLQAYLNYTPTEMPGGGLSAHSEMAITEALVTGRGVMWPETYKMPGSDKTLTGCFFDSQSNLFIDPDCTTLADAYWIARRRREPYWVVEKKFNYPADALKQYAKMESANRQSEVKGDTFGATSRSQGRTNDIIEYYEVYSKMGVGARLAGVDTPLQEALDRVVGEYAYLAICKDVPFPLNAKSKMMVTGSDEDVEKAFRWPVPYWMDSRWPCAVLEFYKKIGEPYPIAPMAPGLGELAYLNVFISHVAGRIWSSSRDFVAVLESARKFVEPVLKGGDDMAMLPLPSTHQDVNKVIQFLQQPQMNKDAWEVIDRITQQFERRVGLNELLYGLNPGGAQSRSAEDVKTKKDYLSVRPDYMSGKVEAHQTELADMEKFCARWYVEAKDVKDMFGTVGAHLWSVNVTSKDPELVLRDMRATVEAGSARKPNKEREAANMEAAIQFMFPELSKHADATGDTNPINAIIQKWGEAVDEDVDDMMMGERKPKPDDQAVQMQMQMQQAEIEKTQADAEKSKADAAATMAELQGGDAQAQVEAEKAQVEMQTMMQKAEIDLAAKQQKMQMDAEIAMLKLEMQKQKMELDAIQGQMKLKMESDSHQLQMGQQQEAHARQMEADEEARESDLEGQRLKNEAAKQQADLKLDTARQSSKVKVDTAKAQSKVKIDTTKEQSKAKVEATKAQAKAKPKGDKK